MQLPKKIDLSKIPKQGNGTIGTYINIDEDYHASTNQAFIQELINDRDVPLKEALYTVLPEGGKLNGYPSCACGYSVYSITPGVDVGDKCVKCRQPVQPVIGGNLNNLLWLQKPVGLTRFINPKVFVDLAALTKEAYFKNFDPWRFLTDPTYKPTGAGREATLYLKMETWVSDGVERGYEYFSNNLRELVRRTLEEMPKHLRNPKQAWLDARRDMFKIMEYPDELLFSNVLPVLNKLILLIEKNGDNFARTPAVELYGRAITTILKYPVKPTGVAQDSKYRRKLDKELAQMAWLMVEFFTITMKEEGQKEGIVKSDIYGQRSDFTYRGVVVSIQGPHHGDECHLPWAFGIVLLTPFILPRLTKLGFSISDALSFVEEHTLTYHPILDNIMNNDIIPNFKKGLKIGADEHLSTLPGIPSYTIRYPTLEVHSGQLLTITKIKTDPKDLSVGISALGQPGWRGDHDGDEFSAKIAIDKLMYKALQSAHLSANTMDLNTPYSYGRAVELPDPVCQAWAGFAYIHKRR